MSSITVTIASDGTTTPSDIQASPGDTVSFHADGADAVLCLHPEAFFGGSRYEISNGETVDLTVQPDASGRFDFIVVVGDLTASCRDGSRDKHMGGSGGVG
ncbi:hypothetical protein [Rubrivirga sp.]|uniref:hypothetical protein n=1 Tax=Rubrivirga sp. TaxID=1885344 RepID=UPI003B520AD3